jgi:DnaK suppressor protein
MPLSQDDLNLLRNRLLEELAGLENAEALGQSGQRTVELDQQAVGRLTRMDALQSQAMSKAEAALRARRRHAIHAALARMDEGEYGYCCDCGEEIAPRRLEIDPAAATCVSCASAR